MATIDRPAAATRQTAAERAVRWQRAERCKAVIEAKLAAGEPVVLSDGLGLWTHDIADGLAYQEWVRGE